MLSSLFGKKSDHPMSDMKSAQALIAELPRNDAHKMLMELTDWMESVGENREFKLDHQFQVLSLLDETAQPCVRKLAREYFAPQELGKFQENRLWLALGNWSHTASAAYLAVFDRYYAGDKGGAFKAQLPLLSARAAHALAAYLKYASSHYGPMDPLFWHKVARLYRHGEEHQYLDARIGLYPGVGASVSVRAVLARLLGWYGCGVDTLPPLVMHLTECLVEQYRDSLVLTEQQTADSLFYFDLDAPAVPSRVKAGGKAQSSTRFLTMAAMQPKLEALLVELARNTVPPELNLGGVYAVEPVRVAAQYLLDYLLDPPLRRSPRRGIQVGLSVVNGFSQILDCVNSGTNSSPDAQYWELEDISTTGFRTTLPMRATENIRIGSLVGIQPEGVTHWGVAVVRRLMCDDASRMHVGAEMLANQAIAVNLHYAGGDQPALWLMSKSGEVPGEARLMMKTEAFMMQRTLQTRRAEKNYLLMPISKEQSGSDYDLARFRVIEQDSGEV